METSNQNQRWGHPSADRRGAEILNTLIEVLHIGDQAEYRMLSGLLADIHHTDYRFTNCTAEDDVLALVVSQSFDVILLDFHCDLINFATGCQEIVADPADKKNRISASELLRGARAQGCETPIIVMTDQMEIDVDREAIRTGASDYLIKGRIDSQLLERTIRYAIERKNAEVHLSKLAHYDPLTEIPNRILFRDRLEHALQRAERKQQYLTLMYMDLDGFKQVNDNYGHDIGDKLLQSCAQRLVECMRKSDSVARIGGDEFTVLLENAESPTDIVRIAEKIVNALSEPHRIDNHEVKTGCSIGIAVYPNAGKDADTLLRNADLAMYRAKQDKNSCFRFYTETMNIEARRQFLLETDLQRAVEQQKLSVRYQPRVNLKTGQIVALKSTLHWYHPQRGWLDGENFLSLAEDSHLLQTLGQWELQQVCNDCDLMREHRIKDISISLSLSPKQIQTGELLQQLNTQCKILNLPSNAIELELPENVLVESDSLIEEYLVEGKTKDLAVNINSFGAEFSCLPLLKKLNIKHCILPAELMAAEKDAASNAEIWANIASYFCEAVVADGVDKKAKIQQALDWGCLLGQGSYFGENLTIDKILDKFKKLSLAAS